MCKKQFTIIRKCACCNKDVCITKNNIDDAIYYGKKTYHSSCFISICNKRSNSNRSDISSKWTNILNNLDIIRHDTYIHFIEAIYKDEIFQFIQDKYDIKIIPTTIWQKLSDIYNGKLRGMGTTIPPEDLLDMWKRKIDMLNRISSNNELNGKHMNTVQRLSYDLSILVNKYDSYLKWKEKQKILESEKVLKSEPNIVSQAIVHLSSNILNKNDNDDISDLVDDIFG